VEPEWRQREEILLEQEQRTERVADAVMEVSHGLVQAIWDEISVSHEDGDGRAMLWNLVEVVVVLMQLLLVVVLGVQPAAAVVALMTLQPHCYSPYRPLSSQYLYLVWIHVSCSGTVGLVGVLHLKSQASCWKVRVCFR
jgi:hypothetical protein